MPDFELSGIEAGDAVKFRIQAVGENVRQEIVDALNDATEYGVSIMRAEVPYKSGDLSRSIRVSGVNYSPGGAGGGGYYEASIEIGEGIPYLAAVVEGSGRRGPKGVDIFPAKGNVMVFEKEGEKTVWTKRTKGQKAKADWIIKAQQAANAIIASRIRRIDQVL